MLLTAVNSLGYSKKGWTNGEIGVEWIKEFDKQTSAKADGQYWKLLVDGHNSHYTRGFLEYARAHKILVLCYRAHTTHVLQGLYVVVFATVKHCLSEERDRYEKTTGEQISKTNFLAIYGRAHERALIPETIKSAFQKTGICPFNRDVISKEAMAPSKETSCEGYLPAVVLPEIRMLAKMMRSMSLGETSGEGGERRDNGDVRDEVAGTGDSGDNDDGQNAPAPDDSDEDEGGRVSVGSSASMTNGSLGPVNAIRPLIDAMTTGTLAYLVSSATASSASSVPPKIAAPIRPPTKDSASFTPKSTTELAMLERADQTESRGRACKDEMKSCLRHETAI
jgi:hypothetical protein